MGHQPCRKPFLTCPMGEAGKLRLSQGVQWWAECWISPDSFSRAVMISGTHQCARDGSRPWGPAPNVASSFPCKAPWGSVVGKVGHWNTITVLLQKNLTYLDLLQAGGWTQWPSEIPCKLHFSSYPWRNEGAEHEHRGAYSLPASCCLTAPYGTDKCRNNWELAAKKDMAVPQEWEHPVTWEILLTCPAEINLVLTLYTAQSRAHLSPLWPTQAANAKWCWSLTNETLPSAA